jgi:hypothetical protein
MRNFITPRIPKKSSRQHYPTRGDALTAADVRGLIKWKSDGSQASESGLFFSTTRAYKCRPRYRLPSCHNGTHVSDIGIDTSAVATDTVQYVATDQNGLTSTTTRTIIIEAAAAPSIVPPVAGEGDTATSSDTASTTAATAQ